MKKFAEYLQNLRNQHELTQQQMIERLIASDSSFERLDITTYSRWERGATEPKLAKQMLVARTFGDDVTLFFNSTLDSNEAKNIAFEEFIGPVFDPYWLGDREIAIHQTQLPSDDEQSLARIIAFNNNYLKLTSDEGLLNNENITLTTIKDSTGHLLGHHLFSFVPADTPDENLEHCKVENWSLTTLEKNSGNPINMYSISGYNATPEVRLASVINMLHILKEHQEIKYYITNCHRHANYHMYDTHTDCEVIAKGTLINDGGVRVFGKRYSYVRLKIKAESILAAKAVSNLIPHTTRINDVSDQPDG